MKFPTTDLKKRGRAAMRVGFCAVLPAVLATMINGLAPALAATQGESTSMTATANTDDRPATMTPEAKADAFREVLKKMGAGEKVDPQLWSTFVAAQNDGLRTGPAVGSKVPDFSLVDQSGKLLALRDLTGTKGLLLVFFRSADW
jgi:hypothetical protein